MKKFISLALAACMAAGVCVGFAGCGENDDDKDKDGGNGGGLSGNVTLEQLYANASNFTPSGAEATFSEDITNSSYFYASTDELVQALQSGNLPIKKTPTVSSTSISGKAAAKIGQTTDLDYLLTMIESGSSSRTQFTVGFHRGNVAYGDAGRYPEGVTAGDYDALLALYKKASGDDARTLEYATAENGQDVGVVNSYIQKYATESLAYKLLFNLPRLCGGTASETADGYKISYSLENAVKALATTAEGLIGAVTDENAKVSSVLDSAAVTNLLGTIFYGIKAQDALTLANKIFAEVAGSMKPSPKPEEDEQYGQGGESGQTGGVNQGNDDQGGTSSEENKGAGASAANISAAIAESTPSLELPAANSGEKLADYLIRVAKSEWLVTYMKSLGAPLDKNITKLGDLTVKQFMSSVLNVKSLDWDDVKTTALSFITPLKENPAAGLYALMMSDSSNPAPGSLSANVEITFDKNGAVTGLSVAINQKQEAYVDEMTLLDYYKKYYYDSLIGSITNPDNPTQNPVVYEVSYPEMTAEIKANVSFKSSVTLTDLKGLYYRNDAGNRVAIA